jgi:PRTRC genetic system protein B
MGTSKSLRANRAIILYEADHRWGKNGGDGIAATIHPLQTVKGRLTIQPGVVVTMEAIQEAVLALSGAPANQVEFLSETVLASSPTLLCWYHPACVREVYFKCIKEDKANELNGKMVTWVPLLFIAKPKKLHVFALGSSERPTLETPLYNAPLYNVSGDGSVCVGASVNLPSVLSPSRIPELERAVYDTNFSHVSHAGLTHHENGHYGYWKSMVGPRLKSVPVGLLVSANRKVKDLLQTKE